MIRLVFTALLIGSLFVGRYPWFALMMVALLLPLIFYKQPRFELKYFELTFAVFLTWLLIYLVPLPLSLLGESRQGFHTSVGEILLQIDRADMVDVLATLSLNSTGSFRFFIYAFAIWLLYILVRSASERSRYQLSWILFGGLLISITSGLVSHYLIPQDKTILWLLSVPNGEPIGSFVNNNHYAYACLLLAASACYQIAQFLSEDFSSSGNKRGTAPVVISLSLLGLGIAFAGLVTSYSRSGILACGIGIIGLMFFCLIRVKTKASISIVTLLGISFALVLTFSPSEKLNDKLTSLKNPTETKSGQTRLNTWEDSVGMWQKFPVVGIGGEAFRTTYPVFQTVNSRKTIAYAENEYVQSLAEFGAIGFFLLGLCVFFLFLPHLKGSENGNTKISLIAIWLLFATLTHCFFDFPLRHPTNALSLILLLALTLPQSVSQKKTGEVRTAPFFLTKFVYLFSIVTVLGVLAYRDHLWRLDSGAFLDADDREEVVASLQNAPTFSYAWKTLGDQLKLNAQEAPTADKAFQTQDNALTCYRNAAQLNPSNYRIWYFLGLEALEAGDQELAEYAFTHASDLRPYLRRDLEKLLKAR